MTASELVWEVFKGLGSLAGFWSTGYVLWDRYWKHIPQAIVVARPLMEGSRNLVARLAIKNLAARPILIGWEHSPDRMRVAIDNTADKIIDSVFPGRTTVAIDAGELREFPLLKPSDFGALSTDAPLSIDLKWKFAQPIFWQPERTIRVWMKKKDLQSLISEKEVT
jgi:hypothetical protein